MDYPKFRGDPQSFAMILADALRNPNGISGQGGVEGGIDRKLLTGGGGLNVAIPVGQNGTIVADIGGGGAYGKVGDHGIKQFMPQGSIGYRHEWQF